MTEAEWMASTDPGPMLEFLRGLAPDRKLHLFGVACCRRLWDLVTDRRIHRAVELLERFADGLATVEKLEAATAAVWGAVLTRAEAFILLDDPTATAEIAVQCVLGSPPCEPFGDTNVAPLGCAAAATGYAAHARSCSRSEKEGEGDSTDVEAAYAAEESVQAALLRDLFGPLPFRPVTVHPAVLAWNDRLVVRLAQAIYDGRRWGDMSILGDALLDAGCDDDEVLAHCRSEGPHVRGCWAIDLILGKE
jgi:hypothetical protein